MADQNPWFKLWGSCLTDPDMQNLSLEDWARWVRLGVYIKLHGNKGKITFSAPFTALLDLFKTTDLACVRLTLSHFKHVLTRNDTQSLHMTVKFKKWHKYQIDSSAHRVRNFRARRNALEESRVEEKRRDDFSSFSVTPQKPLAGPYGG